MTSIGETLRRERLARGLDLQQVSQSTKIGTRMLQAMESDDFSKLPGGVFTRSFIKQYAAVLGLDPQSLDEQLRGLQTEAEEPPRQEGRRETIAERSHYSLSDYHGGRSSGSLLQSLLWVVLAMAVGSIVYYLMNRSADSKPSPSAI
ncbi:MAG: helix-turn-helix domain-containing protein, partial [Acidobacteriota bacterium]|nr:helix-turn-helix domain-containing protein [Acidobacteriota bacterium]